MRIARHLLRRSFLGLSAAMKGYLTLLGANKEIDIQEYFANILNVSPAIVVLMTHLTFLLLKSRPLPFSAITRGRRTRSLINPQPDSLRKIEFSRHFDCRDNALMSARYVCIIVKLNFERMPNFSALLLRDVAFYKI